MINDFTAFKEEVKSRVDIIDIIGEYVELKKHGANYQGLCPFHSEKAPSFNVNRERQFYHCFGCGKGGDVFGFLMDITGMSFMGAIEQLADRAGLKMPEKRALDPSIIEKTDLIIAANLASAEYFHRALCEQAGKAGMDYLLGRGLSKETIRQFRLGFCPLDPAELLSFARTKSVNPDALDDAGIIKKSAYGGAPFNRFGGRIMFPIIDQAARIIGFGARLIEGEGAKYINSPDTPVYHKSRSLYGIHQAKNEIKRTRTAIVVEGYMDVISLHQAGVANVIAASGTAFTTEQARLIARIARNVLLLFDGDSAGISAAARGADTFLSFDATLGISVLPEGHDPDSFVRERGADALRAFIQKPMDIWEFKLTALGKTASSPEEQTKLAAEIADSLSLIEDELKRDVYIKKMSATIGIDIEAMRKAVLGRIRRRFRQKKTELESDTRDALKTYERELLAYIIQYPGLARSFIEETGSKPFENPLVKSITETLFHRIVEGLDISVAALLSSIEDRKVHELITAAVMTKTDEATAGKCIEDYIRRFKQRELDEEMQKLRRQRMKETDEEKRWKLMEKEKELYELRKQYDAG